MLTTTRKNPLLRFSTFSWRRLKEKLCSQYQLLCRSPGVALLPQSSNTTLATKGGQLCNGAPSAACMHIRWARKDEKRENQLCNGAPSAACMHIRWARKDKKRVCEPQPRRGAPSSPCILESWTEMNQRSDACHNYTDELPTNYDKELGIMPAATKQLSARRRLHSGEGGRRKTQ
jgi:hypothetical protein